MRRIWYLVIFSVPPSAFLLWSAFEDRGLALGDLYLIIPFVVLVVGGNFGLDFLGLHMRCDELSGFELAIRAVAGGTMYVALNLLISRLGIAALVAGATLLSCIAPPAMLLPPRIVGR